MTVASDGLFNCTLGGAMIQSGILPNHNVKNQDVAAIQISGVADDIQIHGNAIKLSNSIKITLDGIAKGYAVDCAIAQLKRGGIKAAWVNAGGDLRVYGDLVLPVHRREINGEYVSLGGLQNAALATSTVTVDYDNAFPGKIVGSLVSPALGSWTVMAHYAWRADALTKVACLSATADRAATIERLGGRIVTV
jgi:thiamine biosynthesis lipoprotein